MNRSLKVMTYNIRHGEGTDDKLDLDRIKGVIQKVQPDVVGLQEVDVYFGERSGNIDQATYLAQSLGYELYFAPSIDRGGKKYGNTILSRHPIRDGNIIDLPPKNTKKERRTLLRATISFHNQDLKIYVTHLGTKEDPAQCEQIKKVFDVLNGQEKMDNILNRDTESRKSKALRLVTQLHKLEELRRRRKTETTLWGFLVGDFNAEFEKLEPSKGSLEEASRCGKGEPWGDVDFIFSNLPTSSVVATGEEPKGPSDHPARWAEYTIPPYVIS
jgi:endonuclease/exonuclease/phosphatase family metal-dependent hydrolase